MNPQLVILFVALPMTAGLCAIALVKHRLVQRALGLAFLLAQFVLAAVTVVNVYRGADRAGRVLVAQMGNWPAPFGITLAVDTLAALMLTVAAVVALAVFVYCITQLPRDAESGWFHALFHFQIMGVNWCFVTGDLFNLFVAFEIMLMASYALFFIAADRSRMRQAYKYLLLNLFASMILVTAAGLVYGQTGTLNFADLARLAVTGGLPRSMLPVIALLVIVFAAKTAVFPLWFWLPETYPTLHPVIGGFFAGLLTKAGAYVIARVLVMTFGSMILFDSDPPTNVSFPVREMIFPLLLVSAGITMFLGVLGAVSMHTVRRILSIHILSQVGYMILGLGLFTHVAVAGAIFFILHNMVVKTSLFLCGGMMARHAGDDDLHSIGGLLKRSPWLATLFLVAALSLAGLPPFSGFFGKWLLISASFQSHQYTLAALALATSVLTLLSMLKIWSYGFWSPPMGQHADNPHVQPPQTAGGIAAIVLLVGVALSMGFFAQHWLKLCDSAARGVIDPRPYITAVLGDRALPVASPQEATP